MSGRRWPLALLGFTCIGVVVALVANAFQRSPQGDGSRYTVVGVCLACKQPAEVESSGQAPPLTCPTCGEQAVLPWYHCSECRVRFVLRPDQFDRTITPHNLPIPLCPKCGGSCTGAWSVLCGDGQTVTDLPLPEWPGPQ
jgi:predicted RNA-binding Zn-ribbon protein involved in translation (DUF1610 family)